MQHAKLAAGFKLNTPLSHFNDHAPAHFIVIHVTQLSSNSIDKKTSIDSSHATCVKSLRVWTSGNQLVNWSMPLHLD